jgi:arginyl-tRNA synthetase
LKEHPFTADTPNEEYGTLTGEEHTGLLLALGQYPEVVQATYKSLEPLGVMTYLHTVVDRLVDCLDEEEHELGPAEGEAGPSDSQKTHESEKRLVSPAQSALYEATRIVLGNGMNLLGITPLSDPHLGRADTPIGPP